MKKDTLVNRTCLGLEYVKRALECGSDYSLQAYILERWADLLRARSAREFWLPNGGHE